MTPVRPRDGLRRARSRWASLSGNTRLKLYVIAAGILVVLWTIVPFFWMVWASLMTKPEIVEGIVQAIDRPTLDNYARIVGVAETDALFGGQTRQIGLGFLNSLIVALPTALIATAIATVAGYAFGRFEFSGRMGLLFALLLTRVLPPIAILIPYYMFFQSLGLIGNQGSLILAYLTGITPLLAWILMGYFATLPTDIERAARIDGCSRLGVLRHVMIPDGDSRNQRRLHHRVPVLLERALVRHHSDRRQHRPDPLAGPADGLAKHHTIRSGEHALGRPAAGPGPRLSALHHAPQHRRPDHDA